MKFRRPLFPCLALALVLGGCGDDEKSSRVLSPEDRITHAASSIIISGDPKRTRGAARERAWELYELIVGGADFAKVASQNSDDESRVDGGFLGFLPTHFDTSQSGALQAIRPGQMSPPVWTRIGYQIYLRHSFEEAVRKERELWVWVYGTYISWGADTGLTQEQAGDLAERVLAQLKSGETTLPQVRQKYTRDRKVRPDAFLGPTGRRPARQALYDAVAAVQEGEYAGPLDTQHGWAVLRRGHYLRTLVKHILIQHAGIDLTVSRRPNEAKALAARLLADLRKNPSRWSEFVKNFSDDGGTRGEDGLLHVTTASMPLAFEDMVRKTPIGGLAPEPVFTDDGWHIIRRVK